MFDDYIRQDMPTRDLRVICYTALQQIVKRIEMGLLP